MGFDVLGAVKLSSPVEHWRYELASPLATELIACFIEDTNIPSLPALQTLACEDRLENNT